MAPLARRTWSEMLTEVIQRAGGHDYTGFDVRCQHAIAAAYLDIATTFHHYELDGTTAITIDSSTKAVNLPADLLVVLGVTATIATRLRLLRQVRHSFLVAEQWANPAASVATPTHWSRLGAYIYFDGPSSGTVAGNLYYYKKPTAPDFSSGSSALGAEWDDHILEGAIAKIKRATWRPDLAVVEAQFLKDFVQTVAGRALVEEQLPTAPSASTTGRPHGGPQG